MQRTLRIGWAVAIMCCGMGEVVVRAQVVDRPGGDVQMVPGGAVGKGTSDDSKEGGMAGKTEYVAPSEDEQLSRALLELKSEQAAAGKYAVDDPRLRDLEDQMAALREKIAARSVSPGAPAGVEASDEPVVTMYPRIVREDDLAAAAPDAAISSQAMGPAIGAASQEAPEDAATRGLLGRTPTTLVADAVGLERVLNELQEQTHANFLINWTALATVNIDRNTSVTLKVQQVSAERMLKLVLSLVSGGTASLSYTIDGGIVTISTTEDLSSTKYQDVRVYNVRDLLAMDASFPTQFAAQLYANRVDNLVDTIKSVVAPNSWRDAGGTVGSIRELNGLLIVNQTKDNLRAVEWLLAKLRGMR